jgi:CTP:molybdopterin cytidylyltransferase MocA
VCHHRGTYASQAQHMKIAGLVLAAGGGSRLGRPKADLMVGGVRLVDRAFESCVVAGLNPVVVVLGALWLTPQPLTQGPGGDPPQIWLVGNPDWATGMASSLQAGLTALLADNDIGAVVVTLVDTPCVGQEHLSRIALALRRGATAAVATYSGQARTPVGLTREVWADVAGAVTWDQGARWWLIAHPDLVSDVECADLGAWTDIDTQADLPD